MFWNYLKALKVEIKNVIFASWFHIIRFLGLLLIPLLYGFSYVFAFWDPFKNVDNVPIAYVLQKELKDDQGNITTNEDIFAKAVGKTLANSSKTEIGELELTIKATNVYRDLNNKTEMDNFISSDMTNYHLGIVMPSLTNEVDNLLLSFALPNGSAIDELANGFALFSKLIQNKIQIINNYKNNYLLAFGIDIGSSMSGVHKMIMDVIVKSINSDLYLNHIIPLVANQNTISQDDARILITNVTKGFENLSTSFANNNFELVNIQTQMHEYGKYGFGLAPFFISVAMWVGAMVMTFAVHRKIYDQKISATSRYLAKMTLIVTGTFVQAIILMTSLYIIGFDKIGVKHWFMMLGFAFFMGLIFSTIIQAIRFMIPSRNISILLSVVILILQMASGGGLFPIETQAKTYQVLNKILPIGYTVKTLRELIFETRGNFVGQNIGLLLIYPCLFMPLGMLINRHLTINWYTKMNYQYPGKLTRWEKK